MLLRCVDANAVKKILEEVHEEIYGSHVSGYMMKK